jgi:hypothetical protein
MRQVQDEMAKQKPVIPEPSPRSVGWSLVVGVLIVAAVAVFRTMLSGSG